MRVLSTFSGISAASVAWKPLGLEFAGYCEPSAFQCHVLAERYDATAPKYLSAGKDFAQKKYATITGGSVINFGDITAISDDDLRSLGQTGRRTPPGRFSCIERRDRDGHPAES